MEDFDAVRVQGLGCRVALENRDRSREGPGYTTHGCSSSAATAVAAVLVEV